MTSPGGPDFTEALSDVAIGERVRVVRLTAADPDLLARLSSLGLVPGATVVLRQMRPAAVVAVGATVLALDREIVTGIRVERLSTARPRTG